LELEQSIGQRAREGVGIKSQKGEIKKEGKSGWNGTNERVV
jgi:hypothetical protein